MPPVIHSTDGAPFGMAGLWERWTGGHRATLKSWTVVVTDANDLIRDLHDRMPVILTPEDYAAWLDPENKDAAGLPEMLRPVSRKGSSPRNDSPDLLEITPVTW